MLYKDYIRFVDVFAYRDGVRFCTVFVCGVFFWKRCYTVCCKADCRIEGFCHACLHCCVTLITVAIVATRAYSVYIYVYGYAHIVYVRYNTVCMLYAYSHM